MTEAINAITRYAVVQLGMKRVAITCDIENIKSRKICERLGFHLEATLKAKRISPLTGKISDTLVFVRHGLSNLTDLSVSWEK
jgi:ribosomal-protein-serine acetyltransferase